jgi:glycosyltransferase EpsJ
MHAHPKVTVIMPVYKVEAFVERAVRSVLDQTLVDLELIAVDDGSPDGSGRILDELAAADPRMRVFHQANAGAPAARNLAMDHARGDYLCFMDADDWAEPTMLEELYAFGHANDLQLVVSAFYIDTFFDDAGADCFRQVLGVEGRVFPTQRAFREQAWQLFDKNQLYPPWNKLYLRSYVEERGLRFPATFWDDFPFVLSVIADVERVGVTEKPYYHFTRARAESETARYRPGMYEKREEEHGWMLGLYEHWGVDDEASMETVYRRYAERLVGCVENVTCPDAGLSRREQRAAVRQMVSTPQAKLAVERTRPHSRMMAAMLWPVKAGHPYVAYLEGRLIGLVKRRFGKLFAHLKARR